MRVIYSLAYLLLSIKWRALGDDVFGVDVSFPIHHSTVSANYAWLPHNVDPEHNPTPKQYKDTPIQPLGDKQQFYNEFLEGCRKHYGERGSMCDTTEYDRIAMSLRQPQSMQNYTDMGFKKVRAPDDLYKLLKDHWDKNNQEKMIEKWPAGNTYVNHWASPTYMVSVEDTGLRGGGQSLKQNIWNAARSTLEEWTGQKLSQTSLYGIRIYTEGAILSPHVDRLPLVSSCIVNVAQDVDEPWPLEVIGRDGRAYNVTMEPGDMVLYESHSTIHARPYPLNGRYFANVFIHFEPIQPSSLRSSERTDANKKYRASVNNGVGGHEADVDGLPSYIVPGSAEAARWIKTHPKHSPSMTTLATPAHDAAKQGDVDLLLTLADENTEVLHSKDENGWQPIHEGSRGGHKEVVELLVKHGANVNERTNHGSGGTPLWWAVQSHGDDHPVVYFLKKAGALSIGPEL